MSTAAVRFALRVDASAFIASVEELRAAFEPTPIFDDVLAARGPALVSAADDVVEAAAALDAALGGPW